MIYCIGKGNREGQRMRLLIADDEAVIRQGLLSLDWKSIGMEEVYAVSIGEEARELLLSTAVDIVIFDIRMPGMTGLELSEMVRERPMDTAVVLLTGFSEFDYAVKAIRSGVYEYLLKPVNPRELFDTITDVKLRLEQERYKRNLVREHESQEGKYDTVSQVRNYFLKVSKSTLNILTDLAEEFCHPLSLNELSQRYHFTSSYMSKKIRQETGYSFMDILSAVRLMNAATFLQAGEKVNAACEKAGFNDQRYFSQIFRRVFGCSPSEYKKEEHDASDIRFGNVLEKTAKRQAGQL